jgi:hypothetical protein
MMKADTPLSAFRASDQLIKRKKLLNVAFYLFFLEFFRTAGSLGDRVRVHQRKKTKVSKESRERLVEREKGSPDEDREDKEETEGA